MLLPSHQLFNSIWKLKYKIKINLHHEGVGSHFFSKATLQGEI